MRLPLVSLVLAVTVALIGAVARADFAYDFTELNATNATTSIVANVSAEDRNQELPVTRATSCVQPGNFVSLWFYGTPTGHQHSCEALRDAKPWTMLRAYRSGGRERLHWMYVTREVHHLCLNAWTYYEADGTTVIANVTSSTTTVRSTKPWCALRVYRRGGVQGTQWRYCVCDTPIVTTVDDNDR